ncbi:amidohydrolase family protein [Actinoplanes sp. NPDC023936]|uniref:amidohydrolase family protein n=1 Tax=Actinoplanes sp. NPDC023936 TaxID=3154910 RepID=UPI0033FDE9E6
MDLADDTLTDYLRRLALPGFADIHVHFMPERVLHKVWHYFDTFPPRRGLRWPIHYREDERTRLSILRRLGVVTFTALVYAHKPGMSAWLNDWCREFTAGVPGCVPSATFFPEPGVGAYVREALDHGARVFKSHLQVGGYDPGDPLLDPVWGMLAEAGVPVVCHCGSGPTPGAFTGPGPISEVLARHPSLTLVVAHCGSPEYAAFLDLAAAHPRVHLDTTMAFTDFLNGLAPYPKDLVPKLADLGDRIVLGSDFPNIPYPYAHQIEVLDRLGLGDDWLRAVLHDNGARLLTS